MNRLSRLAARVTGFRRDERGGMTILALYVLGGALLVSAFAIDFAYLMSARTQLQVAADSAAHAALYYRESHSPDSAKAKAVAIAAHDMPSETYGSVLRPSDVQFGIWDYATRTFTPNDHVSNAVRVRPSRAASTGNPVSTYLFRLLNHKDWDIVTEAIFVTFQPPCMTEGFVAEGIVDIQSNNGFSSGFCVHSNTYVSLNSNNTFEPGTVVSMPDLEQLDMPKSGFKTNEGLEVALRKGYYRMRVLRKLDAIYADLSSGWGRYVPDYITGMALIPLSGANTFDETSFEQGRIHRISCGDNAKISIPGDTHLKDMVIIADCAVHFGQDVLLENVVFFNTSTGPKSFYSAKGMQLGIDDNCAEGGGAQLVTRGGVEVAANLRLFGGQIIAGETIQFAANAEGIQGASLIAGGMIDGTSNMDMGFCGSGMEQNFTASYFRLAL